MQDIPLHLYVGGSLLLYFILGIKAYLFDLWIGIPIRMFFYRLFHKEELPEADRFGFIHKRSGRSKLLWAGSIAFFSSILIVITMHSNPIIEVVTYFFDTTCVFLGFLAGPWAWKTIRGKNKVLEVLDSGHEKIISGELAHDAKKTISGLGETAAVMLDEGLEHLTGARPLGTREVKKTSERTLNPEPVVSPPKTRMEELEAARERMKKFTK